MFPVIANTPFIIWRVIKRMYYPDDYQIVQEMARGPVSNVMHSECVQTDPGVPTNPIYLAGKSLSPDNLPTFPESLPVKV
eukprot:scaffold2707_cov417-Prasinococcus_capsulatus_cf.AAC.10